MNDTYCFNKPFFILLLITIISLFIFQFIHFKINYDKLKKNNCKPNNVEKNITIINEKQNIPPVPPVPSVDPVRQYDYRKVYDPLEDPTRRVSRYDIPPVYLKNLIDIPTRGYPDNFTQIGVLIKTNNTNNDNKIIRLFGRQEYPGSNRYEYYTMINNGLDQIKIPIKNRAGRELYDGDSVKIRELDEFYKVKLFKYDAPKYYPDIIF